MSGVTRHVPMRRCLYCRVSQPSGRPASGMLRLAKVDGAYRLDEARRLGGRGAWLCRDCAATLVAGDQNDKQARRAFGAQADDVRSQLLQALAAGPARRSPVPGNMDGGVDVG